MKRLTHPDYPGEEIIEPDEDRVTHLTTHCGWVAEEFAPPAQVAAEPVPDAVEAYQLEIWLSRKGLTQTVEQLLGEIPDAVQREEARIRYRRVSRITRSNPLVEMAAGKLGLTPDQTDAAFREMAAI
jgi:hypothetical protein